MRHLPYIGSGPYCYANSFAMMFGEHAPPRPSSNSPRAVRSACRCSGRAAAVRSPWLESGRWLRRRAGGAGLALGPQLRRQRGRGAGTSARRAGAWSCLDRSGRDGILPASAWHDGTDPGRSLCRRAGDRGRLRADARPARLPYATLPLADFMAAWAADTVDYGAPYTLRTGFTRVSAVSETEAIRAALPAAALARHGSATARSRRHAGQRRRRRSAGEQAARRLRRRAPDASDPFRGPRRASRQRRGAWPAGCPRPPPWPPSRRDTSAPCNIRW